MNYILMGHDFGDDIITTIMLFYPNEKLLRLEAPEGTCILSRLSDNEAVAEIYREGEVAEAVSLPLKGKEEKDIRYSLRVAAYKCLMRFKPTKLYWGALTGVRPAKLVWLMWDSGMTNAEVVRCLKEDYFVSDEKIALVTDVAENERQVLKRGDNKLALYIGIPFCPTRCLYCSFTAYPLKQYEKRVDSYLDALEREIKYCADVIKNQAIESLYIGGGTPTSLNERQLERLLSMIGDNFSSFEEYTVEAGRPDTITREKLRILNKYNVGRISINPQTLNDETLRLIGREHTTEMFLKAFEMAREEGHSHINTDIILGLPGEGEREVTNTMEGLAGLSPESITVHTLAVKRASRLKETLDKYNMTDVEAMEKMLSVAAKYTRAMGMHPYYMYRQKNMVGNFENVGWCKPGCECVYNVEIMEEKQSIIALGAGASTKVVYPEENRIERVFNVKSVEDYIGRIDEMIDRKKSLLDSYF